jgi:hypothetical protein
MNNSPFSMGWLMAMFDLPVMTDKERKMSAAGFNLPRLRAGSFAKNAFWFFWGKSQPSPWGGRIVRRGWTDGQWHCRSKKLWDYVADKLLCFESADFTDERRFFYFLSAKSASSADKTNALFVKCIIPGN